MISYETIAKRIDHALLLPTMSEADLLQGCRIAATFEVASVCVKPQAVRLAARELKTSAVVVGTVVGFPHGGQTVASKVFEAVEAIEAGASEIDMVVNIGEVLGSNWVYLEDEIRRVNQAVHQREALLKVIFETCYLTDEQKIRLCEICSEIEVNYVKTSTGFGTNGATVADLILMKQHSSPTLKIKASGGIRDLRTAIEFVELGAERLGVSRTREILEELEQQLGLPARDVSRGTFQDSSKNLLY